MNKNVFLMIIGTFLCIGLPAVVAENPKPGNSIPTIYLPDLTATITYSYTTSTNDHGILCYNTVPLITIMNQGGRFSAKNFESVADWNAGPNHSWQLAATSGLRTLKPGESFTMCGSPVCNLTWCVDDPVRPAWRVRVDPSNVVKERNENNNVITRTFVPPVSIK